MHRRGPYRACHGAHAVDHERRVDDDLAGRLALGVRQEGGVRAHRQPQHARHRLQHAGARVAALLLHATANVAKIVT
jgi:hypothetical protein